MSVASVPYLPHFAVCKKMVARSYQKTAACPEEVVYLVKPLKVLAARVVQQNLNLSTSKMAIDYAELINMQDDESWHQCDLKLRSCETMQKVAKIGNFHEFPQFREKPCHEMFSIDLQDAAKRVADFLYLCRQRGLATDKKSEELRKSCTVRYRKFCILQSDRLKSKQKPILPPLDVAMVHFSHMLQSQEYRSFAKEFGGGFELLAHEALWWTEDMEETSALIWTKQTGEAWGTAWKGPTKGKISFNDDVDLGGAERTLCGIKARDVRVQGETDSYRREPKRAPLEEISLVKAVPEVSNQDALHYLVGVVQDDNFWFDNFLRATYAVMQEEEEKEKEKEKERKRLSFPRDKMESWQVGYQRYLYLLCKWQYRMEYIAFSPSPTIDLFWHAHLLHPAAYWYDVSYILNGNPPMHKLLPQGARSDFLYNARVSDEAKLWEEEFHEPLDEMLMP